MGLKEKWKAFPQVQSQTFMHIYAIWSGSVLVASQPHIFILKIDSRLFQIHRQTLHIQKSKTLKVEGATKKWYLDSTKQILYYKILSFSGCPKTCILSSTKVLSYDKQRFVFCNSMLGCKCQIKSQCDTSTSQYFACHDYLQTWHMTLLVFRTENSIFF